MTNKTFVFIRENMRSMNGPYSYVLLDKENERDDHVRRFFVILI